MIAGDDINIEAGTNTYGSASASHKKRSGFMSSSAVGWAELVKPNT